MDENDANAANISELQEHISLAAARARTLTGDQRTESLTDLQDYYERAIQIRKYTIATLQETAKEVASAHRQTVKKWKCFALFAVVFAAAVISAYTPEVVQVVVNWAEPYATVDRIVSHVLLGCLLLYLSGSVKRKFE
jgi:hypothetical protein